MISTLLLGLVMGMQHAFEADHIAAVSALVSRKRGIRAISRHGAIWGLGHTVALLAICGIALFSSWSMPPSFAAMLERLVGLLLIALGARLVYRLWRDRVHIHVHAHEDGAKHLHSHSHRDEPAAAHDAKHHEHEHFEGGWKTLLVGLTHGAAGSAALTVLLAARMHSPFAALFYVFLFGVGSIVGMSLLTAAIALPLTATARRLTWTNRGLRLVIALGSIAVGIRFLLHP
ncbi:MAG TPA: urease accessory protein [Thermoanaerobaculia bacterium]